MPVSTIASRLSERIDSLKALQATAIAGSPAAAERIRALVELYSATLNRDGGIRDTRADWNVLTKTLTSFADGKEPELKRKHERVSQLYWRATCPTEEGFDTEFFKGQLKLVQTRDSWFEPDGNVRNLLDWIWLHAREVNWLWHLPADVDVLLRYIYGQLGVMLDEKGNPTELGTAFRVLWDEEHTILSGEYRVTLIGKKCFSLERDKTRKNFYDACSFYTVEEIRQTLDSVARMMFGVGKKDKELDIDRKRIGQEEGYYERNRTAIQAYGMADAALTLRLGHELNILAHEVFGFYPKRWSSAASLAKAWVEFHYPRVLKRKKGTFGLFRWSYRGGLFITRNLGRAHGAWELDLRSAYAYALLNLWCLDGLNWRSGNARSTDAVYGSYLITVPYNGYLPWRFADAGADVGNENNIEAWIANQLIFYPTSGDEPHTYYATKEELDWFDEAGVPYAVLRSNELCGTPKDREFPELRGLSDLVKSLKKDSSADTEEGKRAGLHREMLKRVQNSAYGILAESKHGETRFTTWPLAASITAQVRVLVWRERMKIEQGGGICLSINTDSERFIPGSYMPPVGNNVGEFEVKFKDHTVTHFQSGLAMIEHPRKDGKFICDCKGVEHHAGCHCDPAHQREECHSRYLRADDGLGSAQPYPNESTAQMRRRLKHPPAPSEEGGLEIHTTICPCVRCKVAPMISMRKRGAPSLTPSQVLAATGPTISTVMVRPIHFTEAIIQDRMSDAGAIPDGEMDIPEDDGSRRRELSLLSNAKRAEYPDAASLTFKTLNSSLVSGSPLQWQTLQDRPYVQRVLQNLLTPDPPADAPTPA